MINPQKPGDEFTQNKKESIMTEDNNTVEGVMFDRYEEFYHKYVAEFELHGGGIGIGKSPFDHGQSKGHKVLIDTHSGNFVTADGGFSGGVLDMFKCLYHSGKMTINRDDGGLLLYEYGAFYYNYLTEFCVIESGLCLGDSPYDFHEKGHQIFADLHTGKFITSVDGISGDTLDLFKYIYESGQFACYEAMYSG